MASNKFRSLGRPCTTDFFTISLVSRKRLERPLMVLGRIPIYSATCMSFGPDCSDIRRAISISALEMCQRIVGVVISCLPILSQVQIPTQPVCVFFVLGPIIMKTAVITRKFKARPNFVGKYLVYNSLSQGCATMVYVVLCNSFPRHEIWVSFSHNCPV